VLLTAAAPVSSGRQVADPTPGKVREQAVAVQGLWSGLVRTEPGVTSGWHHHGDNDTSVYVVEGAVRLEFGPRWQSSHRGQAR